MLSRRFVIFGLMFALSLAVWPATVVAKKPVDVVLIGSSSMGGALGNELNRQVREAGYSTYRRYRSSAGLCRPDFFDWWKEVRKLPIGEKTRAALVYLGGNDAQGMRLRKRERFDAAGGREVSWIRYGEPGWDGHYMARVISLVDTLCERGVPRVLWLGPVDARKEKLQKRYTHVRDLQRRGVAASRCGVYVDTTGDADFLGTREERKKRRLRSRDGVHLTRLGADVLWERVGNQLLDFIAQAFVTSEGAAFEVRSSDTSEPEDG